MYEQVKKPKENKSRVVANSVAQKRSDERKMVGFVDNRAEAIIQKKLQEKMNNSIPFEQIVQLKGGRQGKRSALVSDAMDDYYDDLNGEEDYLHELQEQEDIEQEEQAYLDLWSNDANVIAYAGQCLTDCNYQNWHDTDSSQGDYCRFIWYFDYGVKVGVNVHYPVGAPKAAGNMYIKDIQNYAVPTPPLMVANSPMTRPVTTKTWR